MYNRWRRLSAGWILSVFLLVFAAGLWPQSALAHPGGWAPFFKTDGQFAQTYFILSNKYGDGPEGNAIPVPQSQLDQTFLPGQSIDFEIETNLINVAPGTGPVSYSIDTGDGNTYQETHITHSFDKTGSYIVRVKASATLQGINGDIEALLVNVVPYKGYQLPKPVMIIDGKTYHNNDSAFYNVNHAINFDASHSTAGGAPIAGYTWDYGDAQKTDDQHASHVYDPTFQFSLAILRVTDQNGLFADAYVFPETKQPQTASSAQSASNQSHGTNTHAKQSLGKQISQNYKQASAWLRSTIARLGGQGQPLPWYFLVIVALVAMVLGGLHALTPGHGKSFMAALLVGKHRARNRDVLILSSAITITHTSVIYLLGFVFLVLDTTLTLPRILPVFERVSAVVVLALGLYLLSKGIRGWLTDRQHKKAHSLGLDHHHQHHHTHSHDAPKDRTGSAWGLFLAGASGGLVPCIDALSLLIIAASVHAVALGLFVVFCFSIGLALAIVAIGLAVIHTKKMLKLEERIGEKVAIIAPIATGCFIILLGIALLLGHQI